MSRTKPHQVAADQDSRQGPARPSRYPLSPRRPRDRPSGLTPADRTKALRDVASFAGVPGVVRHQVAGPFFAADGKAAQAVVPVDLGSKGWNGATGAVGKLRAIARSNADGLAAHIAGPLGGAADSAKAFSGIDSTLLYATLAVVIVLLLITYRSPALWLLPVITAGIALVSAEALIYLLAVHAGLTVNGQSAGILNVLVFGAGTDYALLLTARYREELRRHEDRHEAMAVALRRAGPAIIASGGTVILSLLTLMIAELNSTKGMGPVLAIGVGVAVAARPRVVWAATALVLAAMAVGLTGLKASGLTAAESFSGHRPDSVVGQQVLDRNFPAGVGQPVVVVGNPASSGQLRAAFTGVPGITAVTQPQVHAGHAFLEGTLTKPPDSNAAYTTIDRVRAAVDTVPGAHALVGGTTAVNLDIQRAATRDRNVIIPLILAVVFLILALLLRAILAPVMLIATVVLSFGAALGVSALVFDHVFHFGGADTSFPLFVFVFLVALGIDYNIFLMTRVREEDVVVD